MKFNTETLPKGKVLTKLLTKQIETMRKFDKYKKNLSMIGNDIYSYSTNVARIEGDKLIQLGWWSVTTQKHINFVARELNLTLIK